MSMYSVACCMLHLKMPKDLSFVLLFFYSGFVLYYVVANNTYGKFNIRANGVRECKGPRRVDCGRFMHSVKPGGQFLVVYLYIPTDTFMDYIHVSSYKTGMGRNSAPFSKFRVDNPCEQPLLRETVKTWVGTGKNCVVKKGKYNYTVDLQAVTQMLWRGSFFYGNFTFESSAVGPTCNVGCSQLNITFLPRK